MRIAKRNLKKQSQFTNIVNAANKWKEKELQAAFKEK